MALGGVATGNMNAQLLESATAAESKTGVWPRAAAMAAAIGKNVEVMAALLVISVSQTTRNTRPVAGSQPMREANEPIHSATPFFEWLRQG